MRESKELKSVSTEEVKEVKSVIIEEIKKARRVAVFIDYENIHICLGEISKTINPERFNVFREIGERYGKVVMVKPYAAWDFLYTQQQAFEGVGIRTIPIFSKLKNATDITLVIDCMSASFKDNIDVFVLFAGDGGYAPLVNYLIDEADKEVYLYSVKNGTKGKVYQRLGNNHCWIDEELKDEIIESTEVNINPKVIQIATLLHKGLEKMDFMARNHFFKYINGHPEFKEFDEQKRGQMIDDAIAFRLILPDYKENPNNAEHKTRILKVNYEHPIIKGIGLTPKQ